jgi:hypothetical protein
MSAETFLSLLPLPAGLVLLYWAGRDMWRALK